MEDAAEPIVKLNERRDWKVYEQKMLNIAKKYGKISEALIKGVEPKFTIPSFDGAGKSLTPEQIIDLEEAKLTMKDKRDYEKDKITFTGILVDSLGPSIESALRADKDFEDNYVKNDFLKIWNFLKDFCVMSVMLDVDDLKFGLWHTEQGNRSFDEYVLDLEHKTKYLKANKEQLEDKDLVLIFLKGLDPSRYSECIAEIRAEKGTATYPTTYVQAKDRVRVWGRLRSVESASMGDVTIKGVGQAALVAKSNEKGQKCNRCGETHETKLCPYDYMDMHCDKCDKYGHKTECHKSHFKGKKTKHAFYTTVF